MSLRGAKRRGNHVIAKGRSPCGNLIYVIVRLLRAKVLAVTTPC